MTQPLWSGLSKLLLWWPSHRHHLLAHSVGLSGNVLGGCGLFTAWLPDRAVSESAWTTDRSLPDATDSFWSFWAKRGAVRTSENKWKRRVTSTIDATCCRNQLVHFNATWFSHSIFAPSENLLAVYFCETTSATTPFLKIAGVGFHSQMWLFSLICFDIRSSTISKDLFLQLSVLL